MTGQPRYLATMLVALTVFTFAAASRAQDKFKTAGEKEIRARVVGKDITDSAHWSMYLRPDGTLTGEQGGSRWSGSWKIQNNRLCMSDPGSKSLECYEVQMAGEKINLHPDKGEDFDAIVAKHAASGNQ